MKGWLCLVAASVVGCVPGTPGATGTTATGGGGSSTSTSSSAGAGGGSSYAAFVPGGTLATNAQYRMAHTLGLPGPASAGQSSNKSYRFQGGLVGRTETTP